MQTVKTRSQLATETYLKQSEIQRLLKVSKTTAHKIFVKANELDDEEFGDFRPEPSKVQLKTVLKLNHITLSQLLKQIEYEKSLG